MRGREVYDGAVLRLGLTRRYSHCPWMRKVEGWMCVKSQAGDESFAQFCRGSIARFLVGRD